jgi:hypothetical protein
MRRVLLAIALLCVVALAGAAAYYGPGMRQMAKIGAGYVAKQVCSCVFVGGRDLVACRGDLRPRAERVQAELLLPDRAVRAWVPLLAERVARYRDGSGCTLE